jgi:hypothetical protein
VYSRSRSHCMAWAKRISAHSRGDSIPLRCRNCCVQPSSRATVQGVSCSAALMRGTIAHSAQPDEARGESETPAASPASCAVRGAALESPARAAFD